MSAHLIGWQVQVQTDHTCDSPFSVGCKRAFGILIQNSETSLEANANVASIL